MEVLAWFASHWLDLIQSIGIIAGLSFTAYTTTKDERARRISNAIAINGQYLQIWQELFQYPELGRVLKRDVLLSKEPISEQEELFVNMLILHLGTAYRAMRYDLFVTLDGLDQDIKEFFTLPIPKAVWRQVRAIQDRDFVAFVEGCLK
jgi:hypothetical protein